MFKETVLKNATIRYMSSKLYENVSLNNKYEYKLYAANKT